MIDLVKIAPSHWSFGSRVGDRRQPCRLTHERVLDAFCRHAAIDGFVGQGARDSA
jgi:hypothetical protein